MSEEKVVIHNGSNRAIRTSQGVLPIGGSLAVSPDEAKSLLDYPGIKDASKLVPQTAQTIDALKSKIENLEGTIENLQAQIRQLTPKEVAKPEPVSEPEVEREQPEPKKKGRK